MQLFCAAFMVFCASVVNKAVKTNVITDFWVMLTLLCPLIRPHKSEHAVKESNLWKWLM